MRDALFDQEYQAARNELNDGIDRLIGRIGVVVRSLSAPRPKRSMHRPGHA